MGIFKKVHLKLRLDCVKIDGGKKIDRKPSLLMVLSHASTREPRAARSLRLEGVESYVGDETTS